MGKEDQLLTTSLGQALILIYIGIVIALGTLIDAISIILIMIPIFLPLISAFEPADPVWFGVLTIIALFT